MSVLLYIYSFCCHNNCALVMLLCCAVLCLVAQSCPTLCDTMDCSPPGSSVDGDSPGKNTGVGCHALLQGIFPIQGSIPGLLCFPHCRQILYHPHKESGVGIPRILEWVAYPFFRGSSWPRNQTKVSCIAGGFFTSWATRKAQIIRTFLKKFNQKIYRLLITYIRQKSELCCWNLKSAPSSIQKKRETGLFPCLHIFKWCEIILKNSYQSHHNISPR